jgi:hypothetical protein
MNIEMNFKLNLHVIQLNERYVTLISGNFICGCFWAFAASPSYLFFALFIKTRVFLMSK